MDSKPIYWVKDSSLCVIDGWCWSATDTGVNVCVGKVEDILKEGNER